MEETSLPATSTDAPRQLLQTTALCVLRKRLAIQGYMLQLVQHLKPDDKFKLYDLCVETQAHMANLRSAWFSARRSDISLKQGSESPQYTHLGAENSHRVMQHERHLSAKVNVFCVISRRKTCGPFFVMKARSPGLRVWTCWRTDSRVSYRKTWTTTSSSRMELRLNFTAQSAVVLMKTFDAFGLDELLPLTYRHALRS
jgi:hypothetical protein